MNETLKIIEKRFSCRDFSSKKINNEDLELICHAALQSPSAMHLEPWQIIVVKNEEILKKLEASGMEYLQSLDDNSGYERIMSRGGKLYYNSPCMIVIAIKKTGMELIDLGIVCQNIVLAATALGIDSVICGMIRNSFNDKTKEEFKKLLKFNEGYELGISVLLGYANASKNSHEMDLSKITIIE